MNILRKNLIKAGNPLILKIWLEAWTFTDEVLNFPMEM
jgi:hypothetical protein